MKRGFYPTLGATASARQGTSLELQGRYGRLGKHGNDGLYLALGGYSDSGIFYMESGTAAQGWLTWDGQAMDIPLMISAGAGPRFSHDGSANGGVRYRGLQISAVGFLPLLLVRAVQDVTKNGQRLWFAELGIKAWFP